MKKFKMKSIFAFLATAMLSMMLVGCGGEKKDAAADAGKGDKWVVAINSTFPPFESVKEGTKDYQGVDIDIAHYIAKKMNKKIEFTDMKFASLVPTLQSGRADVIISAISPTSEREKVVSFSKPYYFPMKAILCKKGAGYDAMDKLKGKKAGASMGTTYAKELKAVGGIEVVGSARCRGGDWSVRHLLLLNLGNGGRFAQLATGSDYSDGHCDHGALADRCQQVVGTFTKTRRPDRSRHV